MILEDRNRFECLQNSTILVGYFWESFCSRRVNNRVSRSYEEQVSSYTRTSASFYTLWPVIETFYMTSCRGGLAMVSKLTIAMQYNLHMIIWIVQINFEMD